MAIKKAIEAAEAHYRAREFDRDMLVESRARMATAIDVLNTELAELKTSIEELGVETNTEVLKPKPSPVGPSPPGIVPPEPELVVP
jgi:hypothetical protein